MKHSYTCSKNKFVKHCALLKYSLPWLQYMLDVNFQSYLLTFIFSKTKFSIRMKLMFCEKYAHKKKKKKWDQNFLEICYINFRI